jgi:polar amino acid transport system substrate-binding protein
MTTFTRKVLALAAAAALALTLTACANDTSGDDGDGLDTVTAGKLTIATGEPAYSPWVENDDPESGEGFEAAVAYAVAEQLGFAKADVVWVRTTFDAAIAPGPKDWDINLQQFSITAERAEAVDFSSPYYTTTQAVVTFAGSPADGLTSLADLATIRYGVQVGTTSLDAVEDIIKPTTETAIFSSSDDVVHALINRQVQAIVVDLPTALYITAAEMDDGVIVGQLASASGGDEFGIVLPKDSPLTSAVTAAVDALRANGTLAQLEAEWLSDSIGVPVIS